jgi:hypothetical protein
VNLDTGGTRVSKIMRTKLEINPKDFGKY